MKLIKHHFDLRKTTVFQIFQQKTKEGEKGVRNIYDQPGIVIFHAHFVCNR